MISSDSKVDTEKKGQQRFVEAFFWIVIVVFLFFHAYGSLTRLENYNDPDNMNYVDVARNIVAGRGITQSTLGFNQPRFAPDDPIPVPLTAQPPLTPLAIALFMEVGVPAIDASLVVSAFCYGLVLLLAYRIVISLHNELVAKLAVAFLLFYEPIYSASSAGDSNLLGLFFVFLSLWLLVQVGRANTHKAVWAVAAGLSSGLAFAVRYALVPLVAIGIVFIFFESRSRFRALSLYVMGFSAVAGLVLTHNWVVSAEVMPAPNQSTVGLITNLRMVFSNIFGSYLPDNSVIPNRFQIVLLGICLAVLGILLIRQRRLLTTVRDVFFRERRYILTLWAVAYLVVLVYERTQVHFDNIDARLVLPATSVLVLLFAALVARTATLKTVHVRYFLLVVVVLALVRDAWFVAQTPVHDRSSDVDSSELLTWVASSTTEHDLIIGDDAVYIPFYFGRPAAVSFSPYPYTDYMNYQNLSAFSQRHCTEYERILLAIRTDWAGAEADWQSRFGPFITDIVFGRLQNYPRIDLVQQFMDGSVFRIDCD